MKTFWRVLETLAVVTMVLVWPLGAFAQIGKITPPGGGSVSSGSTISGCTSSILTASAASLLACDPASIVNGSVSTAGRSILTIQDTITGASATSNFLNVTGTFNSTLTAATSGVYVSITGSDEANNQRSLYSLFTASGVGAIGQSAGVYGEFAGTTINNMGAGVHGKSTGVVNSISYPTYGVLGDNVNNNGSKMSIGVGGFANSLNGASGNNIGGFFAGSAQVTTAALSAGVIGLSRDATIAAGGYFGFTATSFSDPGGGNVATNGLFTGKSALIADNQSVAANIFEARDNGTAIWSIVDGGYIQGTRGEVALNANYTNATTTFSNTALSVDVVSGRTYSFDLTLLMADSTAADGMKIDFNGGSATMTIFGVSCVATNDTNGATVAFTAATSAALATVLNVATMASTGVHMVRCSGFMVPSSSSTFIVRAAQNAHTTGTLTINRGSWMSVRDARPL